MSKKHVVACSLRLPAELKAWIEEQAQADKRSFNNYIERLFSDLRQQEQKRERTN